jgi:hypothetical protein
MKLGPLDFQRLVYDFHFYEPFAFTHQGADWADPVLRELAGTRYPMDRSQLEALRTRFNEKKLDDWPLNAYPDCPDREGIRKRIRSLADWAKANGLFLYCGEFGVRKESAPPADRALWIRDARSVLEEHGIAWALWAWRAGFDLADESGAADPAVLRSLGLKD